MPSNTTFTDTKPSPVTNKTGRKTRVRTGCRTCRIRHLKCDESKPACKRCTSTGRACDGYGLLAGGGDLKPTTGGLAKHATNVDALDMFKLYKRTLLPGLGHMDAEEADCFDFFRLHLSERLSGAFHSNFWTKTILQLSVREPAVFHALVALSSLQRRDFVESQPSLAESKGFRSQSIRNKWQRFGLQQYNKAIESLQIHFAAKDHQSIRIALVTCILFTCTDILRGSFSAASAHIENARKMLVSIWTKKYIVHQITDASCALPSKNTRPLDLELVEAIVRMNTQNLVFGHPIRCLLMTSGLEPLNTYHAPGRFLGLADMRRYLEKILNLILRPPEKLNRDKLWSKMCWEEFELQQHILQTSLDRWLEAYDISVEDIRQTLPPRLWSGLALLRIYYSLATIMVSVRGFDNLETSQMKFDAHNDTFIDILVQIMSLSEPYNPIISSTRDSSPMLGSGRLDITADMGILPPLTYTAIKCRDPFIRRKAIKLITRVRHSEGLWDGDVVSAAVRKVVDLEEDGFYEAIVEKASEESFSDRHDEEDDADFMVQNAGQTLSVIPESRRLHDVQVFVEESIDCSQARVVYRCRRGETVVRGEHNIEGPKEIV